jgi:hypothetical protein
MTIANKDNAMDDKNPIAAFSNLKKEFVEITGITITSLIAEILLIRQERGETLTSLTSRIGKTYRELCDRGYTMDDTIMSSVLIISVYDFRVKEKLNDLVTKHLQSKMPLNWTRIAEAARTWEKSHDRMVLASRQTGANSQPTIKNASPYPGNGKKIVKNLRPPRSDGFHAMLSQNTPKRSEVTAKDIPKKSDNSLPCINCNSQKHSGSACPEICSKLNHSGHLYQDCRNRPGYNNRLPPIIKSDVKKKSVNTVKKISDDSSDDEFIGFITAAERSAHAVEGSATADSQQEGDPIANLSQNLQDYAILDSGATDGIFPSSHSDQLVNVQSVIPGKINVTSAFGSKGSVTSIGDCPGIPGKFLVLPDAQKVLIPVSGLDKMGATTIFHNGQSLAFTASGKIKRLVDKVMKQCHTADRTILYGKLYNGLYRINLSDVTGLESPQAHVALYPRIQCHSKAELIKALHQSLKHMPKSSMIRVARYHSIDGWPEALTPSFIEKNYPPCPCCADAFMRQKPLARPKHTSKDRPRLARLPEPDEKTEKFSAVGDMVVSDVFGKFFIPTYSKEHYFVVFKDLFSGKVHVYLMKHKDHMHKYMKLLYEEYSRYGHKIKNFRFDWAYDTKEILMAQKFSGHRLVNIPKMVRLNVLCKLFSDVLLPICKPIQIFQKKLGVFVSRML